MVLLLTSGLTFPVPAAAASTTCANPTASSTTHSPALPALLDGPAVQANGSSFDRWYVCPIGAVNPPAVGVLDIIAERTNAATGNELFICTRAVKDTSALGTTTLDRSDHVSGSPRQRVAYYNPRAPEYRVDVDGDRTGVGDPFGCLLGDQTIPYKLTVRYYSLQPATSSNGFSFATQHLPVADPSQSTPGSGEPSIGVDRFHGNRVYVSAPVGVPSGFGCALGLVATGCNGVDFWFSTDAGQTFKYCNASLPNGGGDSTLAVDSAGSIYSADLAASNIDTQKAASSASGPPTLAAGNDCGLGNTTPTGADADREWLATYLPDPARGTANAQVVLSYHHLVDDNLPYECNSVNGGQVWASPCQAMVTPADGLIYGDAFGNTIIGNQVFDSKGNIYSIWGASTAPDNAPSGGAGAIHNLFVSISANGIVWTNKSIYLSQPLASAGGSGSISVANIFPVIAVDRRDNLYAVWSEKKVGNFNPIVVKFSSSTDHGVTWTKPVVVNTGVTNAVLPWLVAGNDGRVDIVYVGGNGTSADDVRSNWYIYMAQTLNGHAANPTFTSTLVSPQPVRFANICFNGLLCLTDGDDGRILLDFMQVDLDSNCMANISYADAGPDTIGYPQGNPSSVSGVQPWTDYAKQTGGQPLCGPVLGTSTAPPPAIAAALPAQLPPSSTAKRVLPVVPVVLLAAGLALLRRRRRPTGLLRQGRCKLGG